MCVVRYAYTGRADLSGEGEEAVTAMEVLAAADYYQLAGLKRLCEDSLLQQLQYGSLAPEEVLHTVVLADRYGAPALKERALDVAASNLKQLRAHPEWKDFASQHHDLVAELMGVMADKLEQAQQQAGRYSYPPQAPMGPMGAGMGSMGGGMGPSMGTGMGAPLMSFNHLDPMDPFGHIVVRPSNRGIRFS